MNRVLIGLTGPAGAGKSTAAFHLVQDHGFERKRFAGPIKAMAYAIGLNERQVDGDLKEVPCDLICGKTPRQFMQWLGTEFGRRLIGETLWIDLWKHSVNSLPEGIPVVVDDLRFPNEEKAFREMGGKIVRITRSSVDVSTSTFTHESEKHQITADFTILNDSSIADLYQSVDYFYFSDFITV